MFLLFQFSNPKAPHSHTSTFDNWVSSVSWVNDTQIRFTSTLLALCVCVFHNSYIGIVPLIKTIVILVCTQPQIQVLNVEFSKQKP